MKALILLAIAILLVSGCTAPQQLPDTGQVSGDQQIQQAEQTLDSEAESLLEEQGEAAEGELLTE